MSLLKESQEEISMITTKPEFKAPSHIAAPGAVAAVVSPTSLMGTWVNTDSHTNDLVKIIITASGSAISAQVFGACEPTPCVWGSVPALAYAGNVSSTAAIAFSAEYKFGFAEVIVVGHLSGKFLDVETFTQFTDGSGRSNLYTTDQMVKT
jgi:hypothetical protein